jgi:amidase
MSWTGRLDHGSQGRGRRQAGARHSITIADQGRFHYVYGPYVDPVLEVEPGAVVTVETHDAFEGKITSESDKPTEILNFPYLNPQTGPIFVKGPRRATRWRCASSRSSRAGRSRWAPPA